MLHNHTMYYGLYTYIYIYILYIYLQYIIKNKIIINFDKTTYYLNS